MRRPGLLSAGIVFSVVLLTLLVVGTASAEPVTVTLTNGGNLVLVEFYASPPGVQYWEQDILGNDVLGSGESVWVTIADGREDCSYDFLAVFEDAYGQRYELVHASVEVCDGERYVYTY